MSQVFVLKDNISCHLRYTVVHFASFKSIGGVCIQSVWELSKNALYRPRNHVRSLLNYYPVFSKIVILKIRFLYL